MVCNGSPSVLEDVMTWTVLIPVALLACAEPRPGVTASPGADTSDHIAADSGAAAPDTDAADSSSNDTARDEDETGLVLHVATWGDDGDIGSEAQPLATLEAARDAIRMHRQDSTLSDGATVILHGGTHTLSTTFALDEQDSGTAAHPIVYRSATEQTVRISGGQALDVSSFTVVSDPDVLSRLVDSSVHGQLLEIDLSAAGLSDYGQLSRRGYNLGWSSVLADPPMELVIDDQIMPLARWPNDGSVTLSGVVDAGPILGDADFWSRGGTFSHALDRTEHWGDADDIWLEGTVGRDWEWTHNHLASVDSKARQITLSYGEVSGILNWQPFFVFRNLLEEIDAPGEYFIDRQRGVLYVLPPADFGSSSRVVVSTLQDDLVHLDGADHITFRGLIFEDGREHGIHGEDTSGLRVEDCTFRNLGMDAVIMVGTDNQLHRSAVVGVGRRGVFAGPMAWGWPEDGIYSAQAHQNIVADSTFEDFGRLYQAYYPAVDIDGVGSRVHNNRISDGPHMGIQLRGNDHVIEYNELFELGRVFKDIGAIYTNLGKHPGERGSLIRRNFIHHLGQDNDKLFGVYLDNGTMGVTVEENIFYAIGSSEYPNCAAVMSNHGQHIVVRNNMMVDTVRPFRLSLYLNCDGSTAGWGCADQDSFAAAWETYFAAIPSDHSLAYPELDSWSTEAHWEPTTNRYDNNVVYNPAVPLADDADVVDYASDGFILDAANNWTASSDPGFVALESMDFSQRESGDMFSQIPSLRAIPFEDIGPGGLGTTADVPVHADVHVSASAPGERFGGEADVTTRQAQRPTHDQIGYLQVALHTLPDTVEHAELYLYTRVTWAQDAELRIDAVHDDDWDEGSMAPTWESRPAPGAALGTTPVLRDKYAWVGVDVTAFIQAEQAGDGVASFAVQPADSGQALILVRATEQGPSGGVTRSAFLRATLP